MAYRWTPDLPRELRDAAQRELEPGENLLWTGRPDAGRMARQATLIWFVGVPWTVSSLWMWSTSGFGKATDQPGPGLFFRLFDLPFVLIGFGMLSAPYWAYRKGLNTVYAVTNKRVFILTAGKRWHVESYVPTSGSDFERTETANGSGDLIFLRRSRLDSDGDRVTNKVGFYGIPEVRRVERLLRDNFLTGTGVPREQGAVSLDR
jgi:hypothetical protein